MHILKSLFLAILLLLPLPAIAADDPYYGGFDGRWEGTLRFVPAEAYDPEIGYATESARYAFAIKGDTVSVYSNDGTGWEESMPGNFRIAMHKTNGVIFAHHSSIDDKSGKTYGWVETWNFTFTHKDENSLYVLFTRAVNNLGVPYDYRAQGARGRMLTIAHGEFVRAGSVTVP
jgi:hypothetical protein